MSITYPTMKNLFIIFLLFVICKPSIAQHFDPIYNVQEGEYRTWMDSGYYFVPELVSWDIKKIFGKSERTGIKMNFSSSDESGLVYSGSAILIMENNDIPEDINFSRNQSGESLILFPQDLLLCPSPSAEMSMGQADPYFPIYLSGEINSYKGKILNIPIPVTVQLNNMRVN